MRSRLLTVSTSAVLGFGVMTGVVACGDDETETVTQTETEAVTQTAPAPATEETETQTGGGGGGGGQSEFQDCVEQTGNPDFCANLPPGE